MMETAKAFEKADTFSVSNQADIYRISDSKEPPWEKAGLGEQEIPVLYRISDSKEPPWASGEPLFKEPLGVPHDAGVKKVETIPTINQSLEGKTHPETGVPFERKTVKDADGNLVEGVFPQFKSVFDAYLPEKLYQASDAKQFDECNKQLKDAVERDPELAKKFTPEQLEQIKNGDTPDGYTWHHNEETGKMQLVDSETHAKTGHTGGKVIWGGGSENR
jgi:hypothetical protein